MSTAAYHKRHEPPPLLLLTTLTTSLHVSAETRRPGSHRLFAGLLPTGPSVHEATGIVPQLRRMFPRMETRLLTALRRVRMARTVSAVDGPSTMTRRTPRTRRQRSLMMSTFTTTCKINSSALCLPMVLPNMPTRSKPSTTACNWRKALELLYLPTSLGEGVSLV